ncbi:MAG: DUF885 domain-containing protein [Sphingomonadaceae bacterium]
MPDFTRRQTVAVLVAAAATPAVAARRKALPPPTVGPLQTIADDLLSHYRETAVYNGTSGALDGGALARRMDDYSPAGEAAGRAQIKASKDLLTRIRIRSDSPDVKYLSVANAVLDNSLRSASVPYGRINPFNFAGHVPYLVTQLAGPHIDSINVMMEQQSLGSVGAVDAWIEKLDAMGAGLDGVIATLRSDSAAGCHPPRILLEKALPVLDAFLKGKGAKQPLIQSFAARTTTAGLARKMRQTALKRAILALDQRTRPGFARLRAELVTMLSTARAEAGIWAQPRGDELYAANVRASGDTKLSPDDIHTIGLSEVTRISEAMNQLLTTAGMTQGSIGDRMQALAKDPRQLFADSAAGREELLAYVRAKVTAAEARYADWLPAALKPRQSLIIKRVPLATEASAPGGFYDSPSLDGARPGTYWINLRDMTAVPRFRLPTLSYHEGVPGHHTQVSIASALGQAPLIVRIASFNAYQEGWALYAERLMAESGAYNDDPFGDLGRLQDELFRAVRLVVDTGIHHKRWPREKAIDYMKGVTGVALSRVTAEIERYMAWPAQALGYKLGQLRLTDLRARYVNGNKEGLRAFHASVLGGGAMPLDLVEARLGLD